MTLHRLNMAEPGEVTPRVFFEFLCPTLLKARRARCLELGGRYVFVLKGAQGGSWTLDFITVDVKPLAMSGAELRVEMDAADFAPFLSGKLDLTAALASRRVVVDGTPEHLLKLSEIIAPLEPS